MNKAVADNISDIIQNGVRTIDTENKVYKGIDMEALRCVVDRGGLDNFLIQGRMLKDDILPKHAVQLMSPMDRIGHLSVLCKYCLCPIVLNIVLVLRSHIILKLFQS